MKKWMKGVATAAIAAVVGFGGFAQAEAATNDQVATFLTDAVATQLGLTSTDTLHQLIVDAMANNLIDPTVTDAATAAVDGVSTLTPEELAALLDANLTQQLTVIEQRLVDLGVGTDPNTPTDPPVVVDDDDVNGEDDAYEDDSDDATVDDDAYETDDDSSDVEDSSDVDDEDGDDDLSGDVDDDSDDDED